MSQTGRSSRLTYRGVLNAFIIASRKEKGAASDMFKLAQRSSGLDDFLSKCKAAEEFFLSDAAGQAQVSELPVKWGQTRSDIKAAINLGLDLNKYPSYHKMKAAKVAANAALRGETVQPEHVQPKLDDIEIVPNQQLPPLDGLQVQAEVRDDGVIIVPSDDTPVERAEPERMAHVRTGQDPRGARRNPELTMAEALEQGLVLDAQTNVLMPEDMRPLVVALSKMDEVGRARLVKRFTKEAHDALSRRGDANAAQRRSSGSH